MLFFYVFLTLILTAISAWFAASETAFFSLPASKVKFWKLSTEEEKQHVAYLLSYSKRLLVLIFMLNTVVNILLQNTVSETFDLLHGSPILKIVTPVIIILMFGEFFPKYLGLLYGESLALKAASSFIFLERLFLPIQKVITAIAETLSKTLFFFLKKEPPLVKNELESILKHCEKLGVLSPQEAIFVHATVDFDRKEARDIMTPRSALSYLTLSNLRIGNIQEYREKTEKTSILLVEETIDNPIGAILGVQALFLASNRKEEALSTAKKQIFFAPETMPTHKLVDEFARKGAHIACIVDEHGTLSGCVFREDIRESLLGFHTKKGFIHKVSEQIQDKSMVLPGSTPLSTVNELLHLSLESKYHTATLSGFLVEKLDMIPPSGTCYATQNVEFRVISSSEKTINFVFVQHKTALEKKRKEL